MSPNLIFILFLTTFIYATAKPGGHRFIPWREYGSESYNESDYSDDPYEVSWEHPDLPDRIRNTRIQRTHQASPRFPLMADTYPWYKSHQRGYWKKMAEKK